ncbi:MAG: hypothetical protein ABH877_02065 [bacterium]
MRRAIHLSLSVLLATPALGCGDDRRQPGPGAAASAEFNEGPSDRALIFVNEVPIGLVVPAEVGGGLGDDLVAVVDLARALDGTEEIGGGRLLVRGSRLFATRTGGCPGCPLRVRRPVLVSSRVTPPEKGRYLPLADLILALEGQLEGGASAGDIRIRVGPCRWCILEPAQQ